MFRGGIEFFLFDDEEFVGLTTPGVVVPPEPEPGPEPEEECVPTHRVLELIADAFIELGLIAVEEVESLDASMALRGLDRLNNMRDTFNAEGLMIVSFRQETFPLIVGNQNPTIGLTGTFHTDRPTKVEKAVLIDTTVTPNKRYEMKLMDYVEWVQRPFSSQSDRLPGGLYYEPAIPNGILHLSHKPTVALTLELTTWSPWRAVCSLVEELILEPSQYECAMYNLAVRLAPIYGVPLNPFTMQMATETRTKMKAINAAARTKRQTSDVPIFSR